MVRSGSPREVQEAVPAVREHRGEFLSQSSPHVLYDDDDDDDDDGDDGLLHLVLLLQDPSRNHKSYRDLITGLRPPLIPFTPLLLKGQRVT